MGIESECKKLLKKLTDRSRKMHGGLRAMAREMEMPFSTITYIVNGSSTGTVKTWTKIEKYFDDLAAK